MSSPAPLRAPTRGGAAGAGGGWRVPVTSRRSSRRIIRPLGMIEWRHDLAAKGVKVDEAEGHIKALGDEDWRVRMEAAVALGNIGDPRAVEPLIRALGDKDWRVRMEAAVALGNIGDPRAVEPLIQALGDKSGSVRRVAARALGEIGDPRAVEPLTRALRDENQYVRRVAAGALGKILKK